MKYTDLKSEDLEAYLEKYNIKSICTVTEKSFKQVLIIKLFDNSILRYEINNIEDIDDIIQSYIDEKEKLNKISEI